jgi:hypothetical protein
MKAQLRIILSLASIVIALAAALPATAVQREPAAQSSGPSAAAGAIAYVHAHPDGTTDFHLIQPDGSHDQIIATLPISSALYIPELAWRPDGVELAFSSNHEETTSFWHTDLYAMRPDGSGLRRITNGPDASALASYPKGTVTVNVQVNAGGPYLVYIDGAPSPQVVTAGSHRLTFTNVAVFPGGRFQRVVAMFGFDRWFTPGVGAVLHAGQTVDAGTLVIGGQGISELGPSTLSWRSDGTKLAFRFLECCYDMIAAYPPEEDDGTTLLEPLGFANLIDYAPLAAKANQFLYTSADVFNGNAILLGIEGQSTNQPLVSTGYLFQQLHDMKWLPDGSGFVYSEDGLNSDGTLVVDSNLYEYDFASHASKPITHFTSEFAARLGISPDGQQIVFEHSTDDKAVDGLWIVNRDGSNPHLFVPGPGVARPAWSRVAPQLPKKVLLALIRN